jgi:hypothetical protein
MKWVLLPILVIGILSLTACGAPSETQFVQYENEEFGFSIDYPKGWQLKEPKSGEVRIEPKDSEYNQVQIGALAETPVISSLAESETAAFIETVLQRFFDLLEASNLNILVNERATGRWDWVASFTAVHKDGTPLQGSLFIKESNSTCYVLTLIQCMDWPKGQQVVNSFRLTE